jgi:hypothetical protein
MAGNSKNKDIIKTIESVDIFALKQNQIPQKNTKIINNCLHITRGVEDVKKEISIWFGYKTAIITIRKYRDFLTLIIID